ncbi:hypothetical protein [Nocardia tenerifensis]|nr:hypothetical protein [Nocardia tenerifensis]
MAVSTARLTKLVAAAVTEASLAAGYVASEPLDGMDVAEPGSRKPSWGRVWCAKADSGCPHMTAAVMATVQKDGFGGVGINARAWIVSAAVADVLRDMPGAALAGGGAEPNFLESVLFGFFEHPQDPREISVAGEAAIADGVGEFTRLLAGPVEDWFAARGSVSALLELALLPNLTGLDRANPDPVRLRGIVILCALNGRSRDAAALIDEYLRRDGFHKWDSIEQASAFDAAMRERFPEYRQARGD